MTRYAAFTKASAMLTCRVLADALNIAFFVVVSRLLGPEGIGIYSYGFALAALVFAASSLGIEQYAIREYQGARLPERSRLLSELLGLQLGVAALAALVLSLYLLVTNASFATAAVVYELSAYQVCSAIAATLFVPALAGQDMVRPSLLALLTRGVAFVLAALILLSGWGGLPVALLAFPAMSAVYVAAAIGSARRHALTIRLTASLASIRNAARAMRSFATVEAFGQLLAKAGVIVLTLMAGAHSAGVYATGLKFLEVSFLPLWFLGVALYPRLCRAHLEASPERAGLQRTLLIAASGMSLLVAAMFLFVVPVLLVPVLGPAYEGTQSVIAAMSIIAVVYGFEMALGRVLYARGLQRIRAAAMASGAVLCVLLSAGAAPGMNIEGVILATATSYFAIDLWYAVAVWRKPKSNAVPCGDVHSLETGASRPRTVDAVRADVSNLTESQS